MNDKESLVYWMNNFIGVTDLYILVIGEMVEGCRDRKQSTIDEGNKWVKSVFKNALSLCGPEMFTETAEEWNELITSRDKLVILLDKVA